MTKVSVYSADNSFLIIEAENHFVYYKTAVPNDHLISRLASIQIKVWLRSVILFFRKLKTKGKS